MQPVDGGPVKIGTTMNLEQRHAALEARYGAKLAILATMEGDREREQEIHDQFAHLRLGRTEQFRPAPELFTFIDRPLLVSPNPDVVEPMPLSPSCKPIVVQIRGSAEYKAWVERVADLDGSTVCGVFDRALRLFAKQNGYPPPPRR